MTCPTCNDYPKLGRDPDGEPVFCEDCERGLEAGMLHWSGLMAKYAETWYRWLSADPEGQSSLSREALKEIRVAYYEAQAEHDRLERQRRELEYGIPVEFVPAPVPV